MVKVYEIFEDVFLQEMAKLPEEKTGLKYPIWLGKVGGQHGPRIKVGNSTKANIGNDSFVVDISLRPKIMTLGNCHIPTQERKSILNWVAQNYDVLKAIFLYFEKGIGNYEELKSKLIPIVKK